MIEYRIGDVFDRMAEIPDGSVDLVLTSPPFLALRSYLPADHPDKGKEIGSEATPAEFVDMLLALTAEWRRVLAPHGSLVVELGDTYSGSGGAGGDYGSEGLRDGQPKFRQMGPNTSYRLHDDGSVKSDSETRRGEPKNNEHLTPYRGGLGWPLAKSLALVPESYRFALAYGINPHTGQESPAGKWRVRNVIRWVRPNPPVGALGDKFRPATSEMVVACVSDRRWFDLDAVREPASPNTHARVAAGAQGRTDLPSQQRDGNWNTLEANNDANPAGAPPLDWWKISPKGYAGAHYAVWPSELCVKPIEAMCPREVCNTCGTPRERVVVTEHVPNRNTNGPQSIGRKWIEGGSAGYEKRADRVVIAETWTDCGHGNYRPGLVLDPFAGTGTTLAVAHGHGRDAIGFDLDERNAELAVERVGPMFLNVVH